MSTRRLAYAVARAETSHSDILREGLDRFQVGSLAIIHGPAYENASTPDTAMLEKYASVVETLHQAETVLPLRYGCLVESETEFKELLSKHQTAWSEGLTQVEGCDEIGVRVLIADMTLVAGNIGQESGELTEKPGTAYLKVLRSRVAGASAKLSESQKIFDVFQGIFASMIRNSAVEMPGPGRENLLSMSFLIPRDQLDQFRDSVKELAKKVPHKVLLTGPWPAYSFASFTKPSTVRSSS